MEDTSQTIRFRIGLLSVCAAIVILALKYWAFRLTGSMALKSDAIEGVVNVLAAAFALGAISFAGKPADKNHPYGHGKIEHFSAAFEGGLITLASLLIVFDGVQTLLRGPGVHDIDAGLLLNFGAGALNGLLGLILLRTGKRHRSRALEADGHHVLSDFYTTLGLAGGLLVYRWTGWAWIDPALAVGIGAWLGLTGVRIVRHAANSLLDEEDPETLRRIVEAVPSVRPPEVIALHELRTMRAGRFTHVDVHVVVPEHFPVGRAHDLVERFSSALLRHSVLRARRGGPVPGPRPEARIGSRGHRGIGDVAGTRGELAAVRPAWAGPGGLRWPPGSSRARPGC
jgi:cation diffusion facilitator family transporter